MRHPWTLLLALAACGTADSDTDVDPIDTDVASTCPVVPPDAWAAPAWDTNAATALALRAQLDALSTRMADAEKGTAAVPTALELRALVDAGAPSLGDVQLPAYEPVIAHVFAEFIPVATAGPQDLVSDAGAFAPGPDGGVFGAKQRGINEGGVEVRQLVDKGLFGGRGGGGPWPRALRTGAVHGGVGPALSGVGGRPRARGAVRARRAAARCGARRV